MEKFEFPILKTKIEGANQTFDLNDQIDRRKYFELKAGEEIEKLKTYLENNSFVAYLLGKKGSGKGTYSKLFMEAVGADKAIHFSLGDLVRSVHEEISDPKKKEGLINFLKTNYRGFIPIEEALEAFEGRSTKTLMPTEFILALAKREIAKFEKKALFIDGFPRDLDQISYSLFFRDLIDYRQDPDIFILLNVPETIIDERIKTRVVCPKCKTPRNYKLLPTKKINYNPETKKFALACDNQSCNGVSMVSKEGDEFGIEPIRERLELDGKLIKQAFSLHGIPKVLLRNSVPVDVAKEYVDQYEITPGYDYEWDEKNKKVNVIEEPWVIADEAGVPSYSLMPAPVVVSMIKQLVKVLGL